MTRVPLLLEMFNLCEMTAITSLPSLSKDEGHFYIKRMLAFEAHLMTHPCNHDLELSFHIKIAMIVTLLLLNVPISGFRIILSRSSLMAEISYFM